MPITQKDFQIASNPSDKILGIMKDGTDILASTYQSVPFPNTAKLYAFGYNGSVLAEKTSFDPSVPWSDPGGPAGAPVRQGTHVFASAAQLFIGGIPFVYSVAWNGTAFTSEKFWGWASGGATAGGAISNPVTDGTYVYVLADYYNFTGPPPAQHFKSLIAFLYSDNNPHTDLDLIGTVNPTISTILAQAGSIYIRSGATVYRYTYNGSAFAQQQAVLTTMQTTAGLYGDGTYIYTVSNDNQSILVLDNTLTPVTTHDMGSAITGIQVSGGYIFVKQTGLGTTSILTFDGAVFTPIESGAVLLGQIVV